MALSLGDRFAVCEQVLRQGSFAADVAAAKAAGVAAVGVDAEAVDAIGAEKARRILDGEGVSVSSYIALARILEDDSETARRLEAAAALGAPSAVVLTGPLGDLPQPEAQAVCRAWLMRTAELASNHGVRIMLEPVHPLMRHLSFVHTLEHGLAMVEGIDGAGVVFDVGHLWWQRDLDRLLRDHIDDIFTVQLANVDAGALANLHYERSPLASGDVPVAALVHLLEAAGYRGWYEDEVLVRSPRDKRVGLVRASREWFEAI